MNGVKENKARRSFQASSILFVVVIAVIMMLVLVPIGYMLYESCTNDMGAFTLENFVRYFKRKSIRESLRNTLLVSAGIGGFGTLLGVTLAFGVSRTNMRFKTLVKSTIIIAIMTPPFLITLAYIILAGPNVGFVNRVLRWLFKLDTSYGPVNIYSIWSLVILGLPQGIATIFMMVFPAIQENIK